MVSPRVFSRLSLATFTATFLIIATGAAVRLTGSGLGCPDWPNCFQHQFVAPLRLNPIIEDGNRFLTGAIVVLIAATLVAAVARAPRRADLVWLSVALLGGVVAAAIQGAYVVSSKLNPWLVSSHLALSLGLLVVAGILHHRSKYQYGPEARHEVRCPWTVGLARWLWVPLTATLLAGMATTGSGPHSGGNLGQVVAKRLPFALHNAAWVHSACALAFIGVVAGAYLVLERTGAPSKVVRGSRRLFVVSAAQGVLGIVQYLTHLPVVLVEIHVIAAASITIGVLQFQLTQVARDREPGLEPAA